VHWLSHFFGLDNLSGPFYGFWSGIGSDLGEVAIIGGLVSIYRKHSCHVDRCWRIAKRSVAGTTLVVCHKHHPEDPPKTAHEVETAAKIANLRS
jgi:hypothetical protein